MTSIPNILPNQALLPSSLSLVDIGTSSKTTSKDVNSADLPLNQDEAILRACVSHAKDALKIVPLSIGNEAVSHHKELKTLIEMAEKKLSQFDRENAVSRRENSNGGSTENNGRTGTLSMLRLANAIHAAFAQVSGGKQGATPSDVKGPQLPPPTLQQERPGNLNLDSNLPIAAYKLLPGSLKDQSVDIETLLCEVEKLLRDTGQKRLESSRTYIKSNSDIRNAQVNKKLKALEAASKARAESLAAANKEGFWSKLSTGLGILVAVLGIALAPMTGGLSLVATAYMVVDLGLQLGEKYSGVKMSIQSGLRIACEKLVDLLAAGTDTPQKRKMIAAILGAVIDLAISVAATVMTLGGGAPKLAKALCKMTQEGRLIVLKASHSIQIGGHVASAGTSIYTGVCGLETADAEYALTSREIQKLEIEKTQTWLEKLMAQCTEELKLVVKELQRHSDMAADILTGNIESRRTTIENLFGRHGVSA
jgi:hypothetical protein